MGGQATAGEMLVEIVGDLAAKIGDRGPAALAGEPDGVHQLRTAVRRLRNVLAAFSAYLDPDAARDLRRQLAGYGDRLAAPRDLEVRAQWCRQVCNEVGLPDDLQERLVAPLAEQHIRAQAAFVSWHASRGAERLHATLRDLAAGSDLAKDSSGPAEVAAREVLVAQAERALAHGADYQTDETAAHTLRKSCRRLRHVADAVARPPAAALGPEAAAVGKVGSRVQGLLGDHRDALLMAAYVRGQMPDDAGERAAYEVVVKAADGAAEAAIAAVPAVLADLETAVRAVGSTVGR